jgi:hypothetical protein
MQAKPDFDSLLNQGANTYNTAVGDWWSSQASDKAHKKAYRQIATQARDYYSRNSRPEPRFIVDYACGNGALLHELHLQFPHSVLIGLDGSEMLLKNLAAKGVGRASVAKVQRKDLFAETGPQVRLLETRLPDFKLPKNQADLVFLCFPNLIADEEDLSGFNKNGYSNRFDVRVAELLSRFREMDPEDEVAPVDSHEMFDDLLTAKVYSRNLQRLLKKSGVLIRVDYANAPRHEMTWLTQTRSHFAEGSLEYDIKGYHAVQIFKEMESLYQKSSVILDVYHQTGDETDRNGGYYSTLFESL